MWSFALEPTQIDLYIPPFYDWLTTVVVLLVLIAGFSWILNVKNLSGWKSFAWLIAILALPVIGALGWFFAGRREAKAAASVESVG